MSAYKFTQRAVASPDAPHKPLVRKRARSGGVRWVQVHEPGSRAKKPRTGGSQQHACTHKEHDILSTAEAAAFAAQFWDKKTHPTKASQHEFLATCIDVDLEQDVKHAGRKKYTRKRGHQTTYFFPHGGSRRQICKTQFLHYFKISRIVVESVAKAKGWVPVKPHRLQDWEKLKKYVPSHKHGDVCPNGVPALAERGNNDNESDSE